MNLPLNIAMANQDLAALVEAWVYRGLLEFWQSALPRDHAVYQLMEGRLQVLGVGMSSWQGGWPWEVGSRALAALVDDYRLTPAHFFILALAGQLETEHLVNLAVGELQAPDRAPRLSLHLASAIARALFGSHFRPDDGAAGLGAIELAAHPLVTQRLLVLQGEGPLPLQRLQTNPWLWAILTGRLSHWPGVKTLAEMPPGQLPENLEADLATAAGLLGSGSTAGVILRGNPHSGRGACAQTLARHLGRRAVEIPLDIWLAQPVIRQACRYAGWLPVLRLESMPGASLGLAESPVPVAVVVSGELTLSEGNLLDLAVDVPGFQHRLACWAAALPDRTLANQLASCARLSRESIHWVAQSALQLAERSRQPLSLQHVAEARARLGVDKLRLLAQPVARQVGEDALIATALVKESLQLLVKRAHQRETLWSGLGKTLAVTPNAGVRALFVGESGTGKTLAASYIATCLAAPLYRVDLSAVMNKYIGESEKNLAQLLDQAAACDVVLLFDEADALFGSRSNGQDNGERFANMLTNFLLTRIENHPGVVILTTNSRERIDTAFTRRLDTIIEFPMPDFEERLHLWQSHLGDRGPGEAVYRSLASYSDLAGGQVRNVVLTAAVIAEGNIIKINHLLEGLKAEYRKQGREMPRKLESLGNIKTDV